MLLQKRELLEKKFSTRRHFFQKRAAGYSKNGRRALFSTGRAVAIIIALVLANTTGAFPFTFGELIQVFRIVVIALPIVYFASLLRRKS